ncbi:ATP-binding cassette domain-containing protein [Aeromicrobium sp. S22]|uniref:ABC transporter ATP-binding protein n=1 Tax=Aeromicrobium sp. S22 TaxID=2662029 RepID=UPI00129D8134|nr:ABC transporter ATP-binding protein [Aeromicrobium sp. S22]MRK00478.1 ATP-binding cassette domain-containing protein [Aeromicrobium sp. S22]
MTALLDLQSVDVHYGDFQAIHGISLTLDEGETLAVMGANGAGKSTLLKAVSGLMGASGGTIRFGGQDLLGMAPHQRVAAGISLVPEGRRVFKSLTVEENLRVGAYSRRPGPWDLAAVFEAFPLLAERRSRVGTHLSGGEQQATAIGRALMANPRLLLLDEVSLGLAPVVVKDIYKALPVISSRGTTVLIVEQDVSQALAVADHVQCLLEGRTVLEAPASAVTRDDVASAYFGLEDR